MDKNDKQRITEIKQWLAAYDGPDISIMEVCGSHTAAISKFGISSLLSEKLHLISGPGCPVCVTPTAYIDRLIELALQENTTVVSFGDLLRVPGKERSLSDARSDGARVEMIYSPMDVCKLAKESPQQKFVFAAVGFETTTPVYALLIEQLIAENIKNVQLLTALKTMPEVISWLCEADSGIDGFLAPGHVCAVTGWGLFAPLAAKYNVAFGVAGFEAVPLLYGVYGTIRQVMRARESGVADVKNYYPSVVTEKGNEHAKRLVDQYFTSCDASWRGMGVIQSSGRILREEYAAFDAGSAALTEDHKKNKACRCDQVLMGRALPGDCPLYGSVCNPMNPQGACMVSEEGSCHQYLMHHRVR